MKYLSGILAFVLVFGSCWGQNYPDSGFTNKAEAKNLTVNGLKEGKWVEYQDTDFRKGIMYSTYHPNWIHHGDSTFCLPVDTNLPLCDFIIYKDDKPIGKTRTYRNRKLWLENQYARGEQNGMEKMYYPSGKLESETPYINGVINGIENHFDEDGNLWLQFPYINDTINGVEKEYYESGKIEGEFPFVKGRGNGLSRGYYENGKLKWETPFVDGKINGIDKSYGENGKLKSETIYTNGEKGITKNYDGNGNEIKK